MEHQASKKLISILGKQYPIDTYTNVTDRLLSYVGKKIYGNHNSPLYFVSERIRHFFNNYQDSGSKYEELQFDSPVVTLEDNFDSLLIAKDHVSRKKSDTYYVNSNFLLRSHTSAHQMHCLDKGHKAFMCIADCYRRDEIDRSHFPVFHQCEIFKLYNYKDIFGLNASADQLYDKTQKETSTKQDVYTEPASLYVETKLKTSIEQFVKNFFDDPGLETRWVDAYFPFTHPSFELEIKWRDKWMELLGCGVVRDKILQNANITDHVGFAAGFGLERFAMLKYQVPDIRLFWTGDTGFTHQFENKSPFDVIKFKEFSNCPQCVNDLSFWLPADGQGPNDYDPNDFYDLCRSIGGDMIEQIRLIDEFTHPKSKRISHCYRIIYRASDRALTKEEVNSIHQQIGETCCNRFRVDLR